MPTLPEEHSAHVSIKPGFVWDECPAYLFDIDGTLLLSRDRTHFHAFSESVERVTGASISLEGVPLAGNTDRAILHEALKRSGHTEAFFEEHATEILRTMGVIAEEKRAAFDLEMLPGVAETLAHLAAQGAALGLATGNVEAIGWIKLERLGVRHRFSFGGFSDHFLDRNAMVGHAAELARQRAGAGATVCVVGDTPRDIAAARANALPVIAVATGRYDYATLLALEPEVCTTSLATLLAATGAQA
jgi:phosphoglycolate phosphatase-like HAD superfamily hydrolase